MMIDRVMEESGRTLEMPLLSDPEHAVIDRYGLLNQQDPRQRPIPHPTVFVIDQDGVVRWKFIEINYRIRPTNEDILGALRAMHGEGGMAEEMEMPAEPTGEEPSGA